MKALGDGRYECADGSVHEWDGPDLPECCSACEEEYADDSDGICSFCREDPAIARAARLEEEARMAARRQRNRERLKAWLAENPESRAAVDACRERREQLRALRAGHAMIDRSEDVVRQIQALRRIG